MSDPLPLWVIYDRPTDMPNAFVARKWLNDVPTHEVLQAGTLDGLRSLLPRGLHLLPRDPADDPKIVEVWI